MTREQIEKAALEYAKTKHTDKNLIDIVSWDYIAGAESRQPEIDQLNEEINSLKATLNIEVNKHQRELIEALREATEWVGIDERLPEREKFEKHAELIVKDRYGNCFKGYYRENYRVFGTENPDKSIAIGEIGFVTHWRPINSPKAAELIKKYEI